MKPLVFTLSIPDYQVTTEPEHKAIGRVVDDELRKHFMGQFIVARGIGSSEHPGKTIDELVEIIKRDGTDRYGANRKGDRFLSFTMQQNLKQSCINTKVGRTKSGMGLCSSIRRTSKML